MDSTHADGRRKLRQFDGHWILSVLVINARDTHFDTIFIVRRRCSAGVRRVTKPLKFKKNFGALQRHGTRRKWRWPLAIQSESFRKRGGGAVVRGAYLFKSIYSPEAALDSYFLRLRKLRSRDVRCLMIVAMPKSGSTFLSHTMASLLGYQHAYFAVSYQNVEQELYPPRMVAAFGQGTVVQQHFRANLHNLTMLKRYGIRPVVLVRNVFDVVASLRDHLNRERHDNIPSLYAPDGIRNWPAERQFDFLIKYYVPWLLSFYASWVQAKRDGQLDFLWIHYEDCLPDYLDCIRKVVDYYALAATQRQIQAVLSDSTDLAMRRFNKGVAGRGLTLLSPEQIAEIECMASFYPTVDFSPVGISLAR